MFGFGRRSNESAVLRKNRDICHQARDAYYNCVDSQGESLKPGEIPEKCRKLRKEFEASCKQSWVRHFDKLRERDIKFAKEFSRVIDATASSAKGTTAGQPQR